MRSDTKKLVFRSGDRIDRYRLVQELGAGGQGSVWRVDDLIASGVPKVVKLFATRGAPPASVERLRREARLLASLSHPSLLRCFGLFEDLEAGVLGLVLEFVQGTTLRVAMEDPRWSTRRHGESALRRLAECLAYVHGQRCVHRDLKPENVLVDARFFERPEEARWVRLIDLGIAVEELNTAKLTDTGTIIGTPAYMAPEALAPTRFQGSRSSPTVDMFAFGVIAWELFVGGHPSGLGDDATTGDFGTLYVRKERDSSWGWPPVPEPWRAVLRACLALHPSGRPRDGAALVAMLASRGSEGLGELVQRTVPAGPLFAMHGAGDTEPADELPPSIPGLERGAARVVQGAAAGGLLAIGLFAGWCLARSPSEASDAPSSAATGAPLPSGSAPVLIAVDPPPSSAMAQPKTAPAPRVPVPLDPPLEVTTPAPASSPASSQVLPLPYPWTWTDPGIPAQGEHPCKLVPDGVGLNARGEVNTTLEWAFVRADLRADGKLALDPTLKWALAIENKFLGWLGTKDMSQVPRMVPKSLIGPPYVWFTIWHPGAQDAVQCAPVPPRNWGAGMLVRGVCMDCMSREKSYKFCSCLADPREAPSSEP